MIEPCQLAIVLPTFNERENVRAVLDRLQASLVGIRYEVIFVDDDSPDGTAALVRRIGHTVANVKIIQRIGRRGLASACIEGMLATCAPYIAVMDADLQHDEAILPLMFERISNEHLDLVVGSRNIEGGSMGGITESRIKLSHLGESLSKLTQSHPLSDPMSGFFMVRQAFFERIVHKLSGVGFKILLDIVLSAGPSLRLAEIPYKFRPRQHGESKLDLVVALEYLQLLLEKWFGSFLPVRFFLFCCVGAFGVALHLAILHVLLALRGESFREAQAITTGLVMMINYALNNAITYRDRRRTGWAFVWGLFTFCVACTLGVVANVAVSSEAFRNGMPWYLAAIVGLLFSAVWNFGITSMITWRQSRSITSSRAERRIEAVDAK